MGNIVYLHSLKGKERQDQETSMKDETENFFGKSEEGSQVAEIFIQT